LGKAVGGGLPVGVMFARPEVAALLVPGKHGCTLGGNPICMAVAKTIFDLIARDHLLGHAATLGEQAMAKIKGDSRLSEKVVEVRGRGLMLGIELRSPIEKLVEKGLQRGVVMNVTAQKVVRLAPPVNIPADLFLAGLTSVIETILAG
jgi:acetylornithine/N-succinyldiaminopimelate aminotransferase